MKFLVLLLLPCFSTQLSRDRYVLSNKQNSLLQETCGRRRMHSHGSDGPVVSITYAPKWYPEMPESEVESVQEVVCSGVIISSRHILTAASCLGEITSNCKIIKDVERKNMPRYRVYAGSKCGDPKTCNKREAKKRQMRKVSRAYIPSFHMPTICRGPMGDVAVFELEHDLDLTQHVWSACLPTPKIVYALDNPPVNETSNIMYSGFSADIVRDRSTHKNKTVSVLKRKVAALAECKQGEHLDRVCADSEYPVMCKKNNLGGGLFSAHKSDKSDEHRNYAIGVAIKAHRCGEEAPRAMHWEKQIMNNTAMYTRVFEHTEWICLATGICSDLADIKKVQLINDLPPTSRPREVIELGPLDYERSFAA